MGNNYIYTQVEKLIRKFDTRDPFKILQQMNVIVSEVSSFKNLKGYCFISCKTMYVQISSWLTEEEKRIVAAHELGHLILHKNRLKAAPMTDNSLYNMKDNTEYEANLFAADLLLEDSDIAELSHQEDMDYFGICSTLNVSPELMSFKLYSLTKRGHLYRMPLDIQSDFLAK